MTFVLALLSFAVDAEALSAQALQKAQTGDEKAAQALWQQALQANPRLFSAAFNLGYLHYRRGEFEPAEQLLGTAAAINPKDFNAAYLLGVARSQSGRTDAALRAWRTALALQPGNRKLMRIMALEYRKGHYYREAAEVAERSVDEMDPASWQVAIRSWHDALEHGRALRLAGAFAMRHPEHPSAIFEHGYALYRAGRMAEAEPLLLQATGARGATEEPFFFYGEVLTARGKGEEALAAFREAVKRRPEYTAARLALARGLLSSGNAAAAKEELAAAVRIDPKHPQPHLLLAQILFREGDEAAATRHRKTAAELRKVQPSITEGAQSRPFTP